jgi:hypothetical protein
MSFNINPTLNSLPSSGNNKRYAISFTFDFTDEVGVPLTVQGSELFYGASFTISPLTFVGNNANLPPFKSLLFTLRFDGQGTTTAPVGPTDPGVADGPFYINVPSTGQTHVFGMDLSNAQQRAKSFPSSVNNIWYYITGAIPIVSLSNSELVFTKQVDPQAAETMSGTVWGTLITDDVQPFISHGFGFSTVEEVD